MEQAVKNGIIPIAGQDNPDRTLDILFIHGLGGDAFSTWQYNNDEKYFWPKALHDDFPGCAIWTISYGASLTRWLEDVMPMEDRVENLLNQLALKGIGNKPFVLIVHSMGGLIAKYLLTQAAQSNHNEYQQVAKQCKGVVFLAVPHNGSGWSNLLGFAKILFRGNKIIDQLAKDSSALRQLDKNFGQFCERQNLACFGFYETKEVRLKKKLFGLLSVLPKGIKVVSESSAGSGFLSKPAVPMDDDHLSICKLESKKALLYENIKHIISAYVEEKHVKNRVKPDVIRTDSSVFSINNKRLARLIEQLERLQDQYDRETREEEQIRMEPIIREKQRLIDELTNSK